MSYLRFAGRSLLSQFLAAAVSSSRAVAATSAAIGHLLAPSPEPSRSTARSAAPTGGKGGKREQRSGDDRASVRGRSSATRGAAAKGAASRRASGDAKATGKSSAATKAASAATKSSAGESKSSSSSTGKSRSGAKTAKASAKSATGMAESTEAGAKAKGGTESRRRSGATKAASTGKTTKAESVKGSGTGTAKQKSSATASSKSSTKTTRKTSAAASADKNTRTKADAGSRSGTQKAPARKAGAAKLPARLLQSLQKRLEEELRNVEDQLAELEREHQILTEDREDIDDAFTEESGEGAGKFAEQEREVSLTLKLMDLREKLQRSLEKLKKGTYGLCERCGQPIDRARLEALPYAELCIQCKRREERRF